MRRALLTAVQVVLVLGIGACSEDLSTTSEALTGAVGVAAGDLSCQGSTSVTVSITGASSTTVTPTDLLLIVDESGSIGSANFEIQRQFLINLVNELDELFANGGKVGVAFFAGGGAPNSGSARKIIDLSANQAQVVTAIQNANYAQGGTCTGCGVNLATMMFGTHSDPAHNRMAVVLTDGQATSYPPGYVPPPGTPNNNQVIAGVYLDQTLAAGAAAGVSYIAVGVGNSINVEQLRTIATGPGDTNVYLVTNFAALQAIVASLKKSITEPEASMATLTLDVNTVFAASGAMTSSGTVAQSSNTLTWSIPAIQDTTVNLSYSITHLGNADGSFPLHTSYSYDDAEDNPLVLPDTTVTVTGCDDDGDGVPDTDDQCPGTEPGDPVDPNGCSVDQLCACDAPWKNHGQYVVCVVHTSRDFLNAGLIDQDTRTDLIVAAAHSECGK